MAYKLEGNQENFDFRWFDVGPAAGEQGPLLLALLQENIAACEARINHVRRSMKLFSRAHVLLGRKYDIFEDCV